MAAIFDVRSRRKQIVEQLSSGEAAKLLSSTQADWWETQSSRIELWLQKNPLKIGIPDDGTDETVLSQIKRGNAHPSARLKCWLHIVMELQGLPGVSSDILAFEPPALPEETQDPAIDPAEGSQGSNEPSDLKLDVSSASQEDGHSLSSADTKDSSSPLRGRLRPNRGRSAEREESESIPEGKTDRRRPSSSGSSISARAVAAIAAATAAIQDLEKTGTRADKDNGTEKEEERAASATENDERQESQEPVKKKPLASMSMMERQAEYLKRKQEKIDAERARLEAEKEKELTFQPKIKKYTKPQHASHEESNQGLQAESSSHKGTKAAAKESTKSAKKAPLSRKSSTSSLSSAHSAASSGQISISSNLLESIRAELGVKTGRDSKSVKEEAGASCPPTESVFSDGISSSSSAPLSSPTSPRSAAPSVSVGQGADALDDLPPEIGNETTEEQVSAVPPPQSHRARSNDFSFDANSTADKGRFRIRDASLFAVDSMYRKKDTQAGCDGISLLVGRAEDTGREEVISILFDREKFDEEKAGEWWLMNKSRFL